MVVTDTVEGLVDDSLWFHLDLRNDVLYLCLANRHDEPSYAEEPADGLLALYSEHDGRLIGITVVDFWKRFGTDYSPLAAVQEMERRVSEFARKLAA